MKKFCITAFIFLLLFSANAQIKTLNLNEYPAKTAYVKWYSVSVSDVNGKITEDSERRIIEEYFFDKENLTVYKISYNNKEQPYSYKELKYNNYFLPVSERISDKNGTANNKYTYSTDFKKYEVRNENGGLDRAGEISEDFGKTVIFEYDYFILEKPTYVIKEQTDEKINDFREIEKLSQIKSYRKYTYDYDKLTSIQKIENDNNTETVTYYSIDGESQKYTTQFNDKHQEIFSNKYFNIWYKYNYDTFGSTIEKTSFYRNYLEFSKEADYMAPDRRQIYEINYTSSNKIQIPTTFYDIYDKDKENQTTEVKDSDTSDDEFYKSLIENLDE